MRTIKFKGKRIDNGEWVEGDFISNGFDGCSQCVPFGISTQTNGGSCYPVAIDPATLCQFTGLTDRNGIDIWEGDVVSGSTYDGVPIYGFVCFGNGCFFIKDDGICFYRLMDYTIEVIGNSFDNHELLEVQP